MSELTYIKGKDACLEDSIAKMQATLKKMDFEIEEASWLNPVNNVFSLHINDKRCPGLFTNGKGTSRKSTLASALGEFLERLSTNYFFSDYWLDVEENHQAWLYYPDEKHFDENDIETCLTPELWGFYNDTDELGFNELLSFNDSDEKVKAIPLKNNSTKEVVYFPMNLLSNLYASNGLSAGNTALEAQVQGLSEIFERWVKNKILRENLCLPEIPNEVVEAFPAIVEAVEALKKAGIEVSMRDASLGGQFPVINVTLFEQKTGTCFASFGSHPIFEVALERTLTESLQGRHLDNLDGFQLPVFDAYAVAEDENIENHFIDSSGLIHEVGNEQIMVCDRGTSFGYNTLVSDMRGLASMRSTGCPVVFDATHSVQQPGGQGTTSGGQREMVPVLARSAIAAGVSGVFMETHPDPKNALSDGPNMWPIGNLQPLLETLKMLDDTVKKQGFIESSLLSE